MIETVVLMDADNRTVSVPLSWTDAGVGDAFMAMASGQSWFRVVDLVRLVSIVEQLLDSTKSEKEV